MPAPLEAAGVGVVALVGPPSRFSMSGTVSAIRSMSSSTTRPAGQDQDPIGVGDRGLIVSDQHDASPGSSGRPRGPAPDLRGELDTQAGRAWSSSGPSSFDHRDGLSGSSSRVICSSGLSARTPLSLSAASLGVEQFGQIAFPSSVLAKRSGR